MTHPDEQPRGHGVDDDRAAQDAGWGGDDYDYAYGDDDARDPAAAEPGEDPAGSGAAGEGDPADRAGLILLAVLVVLALLASIIMLFTSSAAWMKIAVLAGLWAAVVGAVLTTRYRRSLAAERGRIVELERLHRAELEKEVATHREQELILEQNYLDSLDSERDETLQQLRAEIAALREQLADLTGELPGERVALRARAERLRELGSADRASSPLRDPGSFDRPEPRAQAHRATATAEGAVGAHTQHGPHGLRGRRGDGARPDEPVDVQEVASGAFRSVRWEPSERAPEPERRAGSHRAPDASVPGPAADAPAEPASEQTPARERKAAREPEAPAEPAPEQTPAREPAASADATAEIPVQPDARQGGRRRAEDHAEGLTVAELLAQMRKNS